MHSLIFFFNDTAPTEIYTLSLHDALPICSACGLDRSHASGRDADAGHGRTRSEEHTSELQSRPHLVCRLLLEKKSQLALICLYDETINELPQALTESQLRPRGQS